MSNILRTSHKKFHYDKPHFKMYVDCQKLNNNLFRVFKQLNEIGVIQITPAQPDTTNRQQIRHNLSDGDLLRRHTCQTRTKAAIYPINTSEAINLIWKAARVVKDRGVNAQQLRHLQYSNIVGMDNDMGEIVGRSKRRLWQIEGEKGGDSQEFKIMDKLVQRLNLSYKKDQLKQLIGMPSYYKGVGSYIKARKQAQSVGVQMKWQNFVMCHKCGTVKLNRRKQGYTCPSIKVIPDPTSRPYAYQQVYLRANYSNLAQVYVLPAGTQGQFSFKGYIHPYARTFSHSCGRFLCVNCIRKQTVRAYDLTGLEEEVGGIDVPLYTDCHFCRNKCFCQRCNILDMTNRVIALYDHLGGCFRKGQSQMVFVNPNCKKFQTFRVTLCNNEKEPTQRAPITTQQMYRRKLRLVQKLLRRQKKYSKPEKDNEPKNRCAGWVTQGRGRKVGQVYPRRTKKQMQQAEAQRLRELAEYKNRRNKKVVVQQNQLEDGKDKQIYEGDDDSVDSQQIFPGLQNFYEGIAKEDGDTVQPIVK